jgi:hypothetical protein
MAIFETGIVQTSTITTVALIWDPSNSSTTTFGALGKVNVLTPAQTLHDVTIVNEGPGILYVGYGSNIAASGSTQGLAVAVGGQATLRGYTATAGSTAGRIYGVSASTSQVTVGLQTVDGTS